MGDLNFNSYKGQVADQFGYDDYQYKKSWRNYKGMRKVVFFFKKNWKIVLVIVGVLLATGILRKIVGMITLLWANRASKATSTAIDYDFLAMTVYNDLHMSLFDWSQNRDAAAGVINSLGSTAEFLELCRHYAVKYSKDLRGQLKDQFSDKQYAELLWK